MTDKIATTRKLVTHKRYGTFEVLNPGDEVVAWRELHNGKDSEVVVGKVEHWLLHECQERWGCTVRLSNGEVFFPTNITCVRKATKLDKALK